MPTKLNDVATEDIAPSEPSEINSKSEPSPSESNVKDIKKEVISENGNSVEESNNAVAVNPDDFQEGMQQNNIFDEATLDLVVELPNSEKVELKLAPSELIQSLSQLLQEREDCCAKTCFSLKLDGTTLDVFSEVRSIENLTENSVIKFVEEPYNTREAKTHFRHTRDLLKSIESIDAYQGVDGQSLSFMNVVARGCCIGTAENGIARESECSPPEYLTPETNLKQLKLLPLHPNVSENGIYKRCVPDCVKVLTLSGWNPPPPNRRFHGDIMYIYVITMENKKISITASTRGFYVNKSTEEVFDPKPDNPKYLNHSLVDTLAQISPMFKKNYAQIMRYRKLMHPFEKMVTPHQVYSWLSPHMPVFYDHMRGEDAFSTRYPLEDHLPGQARDWNEELQTTKDMPSENLEQTIIRERSIFKAYSDFTSVSIRGAMAVLDGNILAINQSEESKNRMFLWSNLFLSLGYDVKEHYAAFGGDTAAHAAPSADLAAVNAVLQSNIEGVYTLGTTVVDYKGQRVAVQSIVPGILEKDQEHSVVYGSFDFGNTIRSSDTTYVKIMKNLGKELDIRPNTVLDASGKDHLLYSAVECKGIIGNDRRPYIIDLLTLFPKDPNFIGDLDKKYISKTMTDHKFPRDFRHKFCFFRREFWRLFKDSRFKFFLISVKGKIHPKFQREIVKQIILETFADDDFKQDMIKQLELILGPEGDFEGEVSTTLEEEQKKALEILDELGSLDETRLNFSVNPNTFHSNVKVPENENDALEKDKKLLLKAAEFMLASTIPAFVMGFLDQSQGVVDVFTLKNKMHESGINMRYLGVVSKNFKRNKFMFPICISSLINRAAKHVYREYVQNIQQHHLGGAIAHFLNCFLSHTTFNAMNLVESDELQPRKKKWNKKKGKRPISNGETPKDIEWTGETANSIWSKIIEDVQMYYAYKLGTTDLETTIKKYKLNKLSLLRAFCKTNGIQLHLREYQFESTKAAKPTFHEEDVVGQYPVVKACEPKCGPAYRLLDLGRKALNNNQIPIAFKNVQGALSMFNNTYGFLHPDIASCCRLLAKMFYVLADFTEAINMQERATLITERVLGVDHADLVMDFLLLGLFYFAHDKLASCLRCIYRARHLFLVANPGGENHPQLALIDLNIGIILYHLAEYDYALRFLKSAKAAYEVLPNQRLKIALSKHLMSKCYASQADFRQALQLERDTHEIYNDILTDKNTRTMESKECVNLLTEMAVKFEKFIREQDKATDPGVAQEFLKTFAIQLQPTTPWTMETLNMANGMMFMRIEYEHLENLRTVIGKKSDLFQNLTIINAAPDNEKNKETNAESSEKPEVKNEA